MKARVKIVKLNIDEMCQCTIFTIGVVTYT
jgi:hypothetical protein